MAEIINVNCEKCGNKLGERENKDLVPTIGTSVQIAEGIIYFQCACGEYKEVDKNTVDVNLYVPGFKRIY